MKKGLLALLVVLLALAGMVANAAVPEMWGIPDIIIGDLEDTPPDGANTDYLFVFPDAFDLDEYYSWVSPGTTTGYGWIFVTESPTPNVISINDTTQTLSIDIYDIDDMASFRNVACSPVGGKNKLHPDPGMFPTTTPILCTLRVQNKVGSTSFFDDGNFNVYTVHGVNDSLTNEFYRVDLLTVDFSSDPGWTFSGITAPASPGIATGIRPVTSYGYDATTDAYWMETTGFDNDFGSWHQAGGDVAPIPYVDGAAYILTAQLFAVPTAAGTPSADNIPVMRMRVQTANEAVGSEMVIQSAGGGAGEVSMDPDSPSTEVLVFDPMDQSAFVGDDLADMYFSFDLLDFVPIGLADEEGLVGISGLDIDTFPVKMIASDLGAPVIQKTYPAGTSFTATYGDFDHAAFGFGATTPEYGLKDGNLMLRASINVAHGACWHSLKAETAGVMIDTSKWYKLTFKVKGSNKDAPWVRLRVYMSDYQRVVNYNLRPTGDWNGQFLPGAAGTDYNVFFVPQAHYGTPIVLGWAFDYIDFDEVHGECELQCSKVTVTKFNSPQVAP